MCRKLRTGATLPLRRVLSRHLVRGRVRGSIGRWRRGLRNGLAGLRLGLWLRLIRRGGNNVVRGRGRPPLVRIGLRRLLLRTLVRRLLLRERNGPKQNEGASEY